jgi:hypothetical protein
VLVIEDDLDDVRVERFGFVGDRMARGGDGGLGMSREQFRDGADQRGRQQRLVALHVDDDRVIVEREERGRLGEAIGAGRGGPLT